MVKSDGIELESEEQEPTEDVLDASTEENVEEAESKPRLPKWAKILLMILPAAIFVTTITLVDHFVGFPASVSANAVTALTGIGLLGVVVIADTIYRNIFVTRMIRRENTKAKIYKEILRDKKEAKVEKSRFDETDEDYSYEEDEEFEDDPDSAEEFDEFDEEEIEEEEYQYDSEDEDETKHYRTKSLAIRGGLFSILIVNALIILGLAVILQIALYGGFTVTDGT